MITLPDPIPFSVTDTHYNITNIGSYPRVTKVLEVVKWDKGALIGWEKHLISRYLKENINLRPLDALLKEACCLANNELIKAGKFGTRCHNWIEADIEDKCQMHERDILPFINNYKTWRSDWKIDGLQSLAIEYPVYSTLFEYAGCIDWLAVDPLDNIYLFDWKTSNAFRQKYYAQVASYCQAFEELTGLKIKQTFIVRFNKFKEGYEVKELTDRKKWFDIFLSCLEIHKEIGD